MERLDQTCGLPIGTRDALHVPFVVASVKPPTLEEFRNFDLKPGDFVRFTDERCTVFVVCEKSEAQGILNPFLDKIDYFDPVVVLIMPGITSPVRHNFDIQPRRKELERQELEQELEAAKASDPGCASCYEIKNNEVIRQ